MFGSLRVKLILVLMVAILPAILVVGWLLVDSRSNAREAAERSFLQLAEVGAVAVKGAATGASRLAAVFGGDPALASVDSAACQTRLSKAISDIGDLAGLALVRDGRIVCAAKAEVATLSPDALAAIARAPAGARLYGSITAPGGEAVLWAMAKPPSGAEGTETANIPAVVAFVGEHLMVTPLAGMMSPLGSVTQIVKPGAMSPDTKLPPAVLRAVAAGVGGTMLVEARDRSGTAFIYSVRPLADFGISLVTGQPRNQLLVSLDRQQVLAVLAPALLLASAIVTLWMGLDRLVIRWLVQVQRVVRAYSAGGLTIRTGAMPGAPEEIAQFGRAFDAMADSIAARTMDLEAEIAQRRHYIRELHHRVKNNLQVITSLIALQRRHLPADQRRVIRFSEDRVNAMSAAYRAAYSQSEAGHIDVGLVLKEVIGRLQIGAESPRLAMDIDIPITGVQVDLDTAIAIAMLLAELLPTRFDAFAASGQKMNVKASVENGRLLLDLPREARPDPSDALSRRFMEAYLRQLSARVSDRQGSDGPRLIVDASLSVGQG